MVQANLIECGLTNLTHRNGKVINIFRTRGNIAAVGTYFTSVTFIIRDKVSLIDVEEDMLVIEANYIYNDGSTVTLIESIK